MLPDSIYWKTDFPDFPLPDPRLLAVHATIARKIGRPAPPGDGGGDGDAHVFLEAYYMQLRARLEAGMRMGRRKADKTAP